MPGMTLEHLYASRTQREALEAAVDRFRANSIQRQDFELELRRMGYERESAARYADLVVSTGDLSYKAPDPTPPPWWERRSSRP